MRQNLESYLMEINNNFSTKAQASWRSGVSPFALSSFQSVTFWVHLLIDKQNITPSSLFLFDYSFFCNIPPWRPTALSRKTLTWKSNWLIEWIVKEVLYRSPGFDCDTGTQRVFSAIGCSDFQLLFTQHNLQRQE